MMVGWVGRFGVVYGCCCLVVLVLCVEFVVCFDDVCDEWMVYYVCVCEVGECDVVYVVEYLLCFDEVVFVVVW